jgi:4'-phosphopantetheinyl transferase
MIEPGLENVLMDSFLWTDRAVTPSLDSATVHLWRIETAHYLNRVEACLACMSTAERARAERFKKEEDRLRYVVGRAALRRLLAGYCGADAAALQFEQNARGKPVLVSSCVEAPIYFNVSHSGGIVLCACTRAGEIGVDIERVEAGKDHARLAARFFAPEEKAALLAMPEKDRLAAFYSYWVCKEAVVKALGEGVPFSLRSFTIEFCQYDKNDVRVIRSDIPSALCLRMIEVAKGYSAAVALAVLRFPRLESFSLVPE